MRRRGVCEAGDGVGRVSMPSVEDGTGSAADSPEGPDGRLW